MEWYLSVKNSEDLRPRRFSFGIGKSWLAGRYATPADAVARAYMEGGSTSDLFVDESSYIPLEVDPAINRWHLRICREATGAWVGHTGRTATYLNGIQLSLGEKTPLNLDDEIQILKCRVLVAGVATIAPEWLLWNDAAVRHISTRIQQECCLAALPILADALEEAGCTDPFLLSSCRLHNVNARRSWVVELLLGLD